MSVAENVIRIVEEKRIAYRLFEHEPVYTSEQAAQVRGVPLKSGVKAMILKTAERAYVLVLLPANRKVDLQKIRQLEHSTKVSLASPADVLTIAGCEIGSVPLFGHKTPLKTYINPEIFDNETVNFNIGSHSRSIQLKANDLKKILDGIWL